MVKCGCEGCSSVGAEEGPDVKYVVHTDKRGRRWHYPRQCAKEGTIRVRVLGTLFTFCSWCYQARKHEEGVEHVGEMVGVADGN